MRDDTKTKKRSLYWTLSAIITGMGFVSFLIWSIIFILLVIGNIIFWSGLPYEMGPTSEDVLWGGWIILMIALFLLLMTPLSLIIASSGALTSIGGLKFIRKKRIFVLMISYIANMIIFLIMSFFFLISILFSIPNRIPFSFFILGPLLISYLIRLILTTIVIFNYYGANNNKATRRNLASQFYNDVPTV